MDRGILDYKIYRGNYSPQFVEMFEGDEITNTPINIVNEFDDVLIQVRKDKQPENGLIKTLQYTSGTIALAAVNKISFDLSVDDESGVFWYDIAFKIKNSNQWITYIEGNVIVENNVSKTQA